MRNMSVEAGRTGLVRAMAILVSVGVMSMVAQKAIAQGKKQAKRPNIIVIMADDMGYGDAGCYGGKLKTPHLDALAKTGMRFTDFHSSGNVCSPTRAGLLTGRYQNRAGIPSVVNADPRVPAHHAGLQPVEFTFAEAMKQAGYATAIFGKWHVGYSKKYNPVHQGFDRFRGFVSGNIDYISHYDRMGVYDWWEGLNHIKEEGYSTHLITKHAVKFIEQNKDKPFCLYVAHEAVHSPWQGPGDKPGRGPDKVKGSGGSPKTRLQIMMQEMDNGVGEIVAKVADARITANTLIFFLSDNGPAGGSAGPLRGKKGSNWEGGHRVPAIAAWPGRIKPGSVSNQLSISIDLMPTMLDIAGIPQPTKRKLDGVSLAPVFAGKSLGKRQLFWNHKAMRDGEWKLILGGKGAPKGEVGLYNLSKDIGEKKNLADKHPDQVKAMRQALEAWGKDVRSNVTPQPDVEAMEKKNAAKPKGKRSLEKSPRKKRRGNSQI